MKYFNILLTISLLFNSALLFCQSTIKTSALTTVVDLGGQIRATTPYGQLIVVSGNRLIVLNSNLKQVLTIPILKEGYGEDTWCINKYQNVIAVLKKDKSSRQINYDIWDLKTLKIINKITFTQDDLLAPDLELSEFGSYFVTMLYRSYGSDKRINGRNAYGQHYFQIWYVGKQFQSKIIKTFDAPDFNEGDKNTIRYKLCDSIGFRVSDKYSLPKFNTFPVQQEFQSIYSDRDLFVSSFKTDEEGMVPTIEGKYLFIKSTSKKYYKVNLAKFQNKEKALAKYPNLFNEPPEKDQFMTTSEYRKLVAKYESEKKNGLSYLASLPVSDEKGNAALGEIESIVVNGMEKEEATFLKYKDQPSPVDESNKITEKTYKIDEIGEYDADNETLEISVCFDGNYQSSIIKLKRDVARELNKGRFEVVGKVRNNIVFDIRLHDWNKNKYYNFPKSFKVSDEDYQEREGCE